MANLSFNGKRVFLTGASGFIGTHLARALLTHGAELHAIRRQLDETTRLPCESLHWHQVDLLDRHGLAAVVKEVKPTLAYHLAAFGTVVYQRDAAETFQVNVQGSLNLWEATEGQPCRVIVAGTCGEYGNAPGQVTEEHACRPESFYSATKHAAVVLLSTLARVSGRELVVLRPFGPYGPCDDPSRVLPHVIVSLLHGEEVRVTAGEQRRDYAYVEDHVQALLLAGLCALPRTGVIYNIGSGKIFTLRELIVAAAEAVSPKALRLVRFGAVPYRPNEVWDMCCDISAARRDLGYEPRIGLSEGLQKTAQWFRANLEAFPAIGVK